MPIPKPKPKEPKADFVSRCIGEIHSEYSEDGEAAAVCYQAWSDAKKSMNRDELLKSIRDRTGRSGVMTADRYLRSIEACFDGGFCPTKLFKSATPEQWKAAIEESERRLTFTHNALKIGTKSIKSGSDAGKGLLMSFDCTVTTPRRDRDKDYLITSGAMLDPQAPLLWQHSGMMPLGPQLGQSKSPDRLRGKFGIADTELGGDAAKLVEAGALRISHGFEPEDGGWEANDDGEGYTFSKFTIFEVSLVSVPSNVDAVITAFSRNELKSEAVRAWGKKEFDGRKTMVAVPGCSCHEKAAEKPPEAKAMDSSMGRCKACGHKGPMSEFMEPEDPSEIDPMGEMGEEKPKEFVALRKEVVQRAFSESPETINELVLSLQGVADQAIAHREDAAWQKTFESLGIE